MQTVIEQAKCKNGHIATPHDGSTFLGEKCKHCGAKYIFYRFIKVINPWKHIQDVLPLEEVDR